MKQKIPFKEKQRHYDYQYNLSYKQEELTLKKEAKLLRKLKEQVMKDGERDEETKD